MEPVSNRINTLRGETVTAKNAAKTKCPNGHPYDGVQSNGARFCIECRRQRVRVNMRNYDKRKRMARENHGQ
jgi:hypothetical protein